MTRRSVRALASTTMVGVALLSGCGNDDGSATSTSGAATTSITSQPTADGRCLVRLHGKGGAGADTVVDDGVTVVAPTGNADGWGARQWLYFPDEEYDSARAVVEEAVATCDRIIVDGFSNGASFAAKLYCRGETFGGRLLTVVVDDPVPDHAVEGCAPDPSVQVALYWTGGLDANAQPGWDCSTGDWTCEGGTTIEIGAYAAALGTEAIESPFDDHQWYLDAPEVTAW